MPSGVTLTGSPSSRDQPLESLRQFPRVPSVIHQRRAPQPPPQLRAAQLGRKPSGAPYQPVPAEFATADYLSDRRQSAPANPRRAACPPRAANGAGAHPPTARLLRPVRTAIAASRGIGIVGALPRHRADRPRTTSEVSTFKFTSLLTAHCSPLSLSKLGFTGNLPDAPVAPDVKRAVRDGRRTLDHLAQVHLAGDASLRR